MWRKYNQEQKLLVLAAILIGLYLAPMFILGEDSHIRVHDNLDSNIAWYKVLKEQQQLFGPIDDTIEQIQNGLPRNAFGTEFSGIQWLHYLLPSMTAYALSQTLIRVFAFIGMYLLLKRHFVKGEDEGFIRVLASLAFALTPVWPSGMLATLGHPLALYAFLNIREGSSKWTDWLILVMLPFYASFILGFFFFLAAMGILWLRDLIVKKNPNWRFLWSIILMTGIFLVIEYRLVFSLIIPEEPTSRNEYFSSELSFWSSFRLIFKNYIIGHTHVMTVHTYVILPLTLLALWFIYRKKWWTNEKRYVQLFILNILLSVWYAFWFYEGWEPIKERINLLNTFNFARFHFLRPLVIYLMFALGCHILWKLGGMWKKLAALALIAQLVVLFALNPEVYYRKVGAPSFKEFYAVKQFSDIRDYIGKPQDSYRVVSIGIHPAIAQYNGFYTLDTYNNYYPLTYKHQFRRIIEKELDKNAEIRRYFDRWGGRCYIFVDELGKKYDYQKGSKKVIKNLQLQTDVLQQMGGEYLFSAIPIENADANRLVLVKVFTDEESVWKIYLYHVQ